jgi:hypothetical protein
MTEPVKVSVAKEEMLEELRNIYRKQRAAEKVMREKGWAPCSLCKCVWLPKGRTICAICESKKKGVRNG